VPGITKEDIEDVEIVDAEELAADGSTSYLSGVSVTSTTTGTKVVDFPVGTNLPLTDDPVEAGDAIVLTGTSGGGDGTYTVASVANDSLVVVEAIASSTGGAAAFRHPPGAAKIGLDISALTRITSNLLQAALEDIDGAQPNAHAASHAENASDEMNAEDLGAVDAGFPNRVMVTTGTGGWVISDEEFLEGLPTEFQHDQSVAQSATTSATYVSKLLLTTAALDGGDYVVFYNAFVGGSQNGTVSAAQIAFDGGTPFGETVLKSSSNNSVNSYAGHEVFFGVTPGVHTVEMFWRLFSGGGSALIQNAQISLWRVN